MSESDVLLLHMSSWTDSVTEDAFVSVQLVSVCVCQSFIRSDGRCLV